MSKRQVAGGRYGVSGPGWEIFADYVIEDGYLAIDAEECGYYEPGDHPELPTAFANLSRASEGDIVAFAKRWGPLGYATLGDKENQNRPWEEEEPIPWIIAHSRGVRLCLDLVRYLSDGSQGDMARYLLSHAEPVKHRIQATDSSFPEVKFRLHFGKGKLQVTDSLFKRHSWEATARAILERIISPNIAGIYPILDFASGTGEERRLIIRYRYTALIEMIYWHLANLVVGSDRVGVCEHCGKYFLQTDKRQRFCPAEHRESESRCARIYRSRKRKAQSNDHQNGGGVGTLPFGGRNE